jgi:TolB-like protein
MKVFLGFISIMLIMGCAGGAGPAPSSGGTSLDKAIAETAGRMETRLNGGTKIALINFSSGSAHFSEYVLEGISLHLVNSGKLIVVDRANLDRVRQEQGFQLSGEVSDESAKAIGQMLGADAIVTGSLTNIGREYRINLKAISVESATVVVQYATDIIEDERVRSLLASGGGSGGGTQSTPARTSGSSPSGTVGTGGSGRVIPTVTSVTVSPENVSVDKGKTQQFEATIIGTNNPALAVTWTVTGNLSRGTTISEDGILTVANDEVATPLTVTATSTADTGKNGRVTVAVPGGISAINVSGVANWNTAINTIRNGGNNQTYIISVIGNVSVPAPPRNENLFGSVTGITVTIQGNGTLSPSVSGCLLSIAAGQTVVVRDVTLRGRSDNDSSMVNIKSGGIFRMEGRASVTGNKYGGVVIEGGTFIMQGGTISGNTSPIWLSSGGGGGVLMERGTFTMHDGTISGNTHSNGGHGGGGVYVSGGTFTMQGGTISGNTSNNRGGGVFVGGGTFNMQGGIITNGNNASRNGGGVYVSSGTFTKTGGTISGNDAALGGRNSSQGQGHAIYWSSSPARWRNATAGPDDKTDGYGFWLND